MRRQHERLHRLIILASCPASIHVSMRVDRLQAFSMWTRYASTISRFFSPDWRITLEQAVHLDDFLELLVDEPLQEALRQVVVLLDGQVHQRA